VPFTFGNLAVVTWDGTDISAYTHSVRLEPTRENRPLSRLGGNQVAYLAGPLRVEARLEGWNHETLDPILGVDLLEEPPVSHTLIFIPAGTGITYTLPCFLTSYQPEAVADDPSRWTATVAGVGETPMTRA
jgi:hypothetical protein